MELTDLRHFKHVAITGSFSRGAKLSHVTAPAVSKAVKKLEEELGVRLFARTSRTVSLTTAGRLVLARCERVFAELDALRAELDDDGPLRLAGALRIGAMEVLSIELLPRSLASLMRAHPGLAPTTYEMVPETMALALREGRIEVGLTVGASPSPGLTIHDFGVTPGVLVCGRSHPLHGRKRIHARDLEEHGSVVPRFLGLEHLPSLDQFPERVLPRRISATIELLQMGVRLCEEGATLGYFPEISVRAELAAGRLWKLNGLPARAPFVLSALTRREAPLRPAVRALLAELSARLAAPHPARLPQKVQSRPALRSSRKASSGR